MSRIKNTLKYWKLVTTNVVLMQFNRAIWGIVSVTICWTRAFKISNVKLYYIDRACLILFAVFVLSSVTRLSYFPYKSVTLYKWPKYRNVGLSVADIDHRQNSSFWRGSSKPSSGSRWGLQKKKKKSFSGLLFELTRFHWNFDLANSLKRQAEQNKSMSYISDRNSEIMGPPLQWIQLNEFA